MKKRILLLIMALLAIFSCTACIPDSNEGSKNNESNPNVETSNDTPKDEASVETSNNTPKDETSYEIIANYNKTGTNSIGTFWMQGIVIIENTGTTNLYLSSGSFDIEDSNGHLVASESYVNAYPEVIAPGEKGIYYSDFSLDGGSASETYTIVPHLDVEKATVPLVRFSVTDVSLADGTFGDLKITGRVENTSDKEESFYPVVAVLYDSNDTVLTVVYTYPDKLAAGDKRGFEINSFSSYADIKCSDVARYEIFAYPTQIQF